MIVTGFDGSRPTFDVHMSTLLKENRRLKEDMERLRQRLSSFLATNVRLEAALAIKQSKSSCGGHAIRIHDLNDDVLKSIVDILLAGRNLTAVNRLRQTCKSLLVVIDSMDIALEYAVDRTLRWDPEISLGGLGVTRDSFTCDGAQVAGSIAWLAAGTLLPSSGRFTWQVHVQHEREGDWGEHLVGVCNEESTHGWGLATMKNRAWNASRPPSGSKVSVELADLGSMHLGGQLTRARLTREAHGMHVYEQITVVLDADAGTLQYSLNGMQQRTLHHQVPRGTCLRPWACVFLGGRYDVVRISSTWDFAADEV